MNEKIQTISPLVDQFSRTISYLRVSVTDRCNLRCMYCMPETENLVPVKTGKFLSHDDLLSYEELLRIIRLVASMGMNKLRLTGGEPLVRKDILKFIAELAKIEGLQQIRLTTNGVLLGENAAELYRLGIRQINMSLDTLKRERFREITGRDYFDNVWKSLQIAHELGFRIKINVVAMKGINDDEFIDFAEFALKYPFQIRFIEFMPAGDAGSWQKSRFIGADDIQEKIAHLGALIPLEKETTPGPARMYTLEAEDGRKGNIGFISPISHHFCDQCNRLRLTSEGHLRACLLRDDETDLKSLLRSGATDGEICNAVRTTILNKPKGHELKTVEDVETRNRYDGGMSKIGG